MLPQNQGSMLPTYSVGKAVDKKRALPSELSALPLLNPLNRFVTRGGLNKMAKAAA